MLATSFVNWLPSKNGNHPHKRNILIFPPHKICTNIENQMQPVVVNSVVTMLEFLFGRPAHMDWIVCSTPELIL